MVSPLQPHRRFSFSHRKSSSGTSRLTVSSSVSPPLLMVKEFS